MTDRKGNKLSVGDRVYVLPDAHTRSGGAGWLRRIVNGARGERARVDDGGPTQAAFGDDNSWSWSAWVTADEVEKV